MKMKLNIVVVVEMKRRKERKEFNVEG